MRLFLSLIVLGYIAYVQASSCSKCNSEERIPVKTCPEPDSEVKVVYSGTACECQKALPYRVEVPAVEKQKLFKHKYNIFKTRDPAACSTSRFVYDAKVEKPVVPKEEFYAYPITVDKKKSDNNDHNCGTSSGVHYIYDAKVERPVHPKQTKLEGLTTKLDTIVLPAQDYSDCYQPGEGYKKKKTSSDYSNINSSSYEESELTPNKYNQPCEQTRSQENKKTEESCGCNKASVESLELKEETAPKKKNPIRIPNCEEKCGCDTVETRPCEEIQNRKRPKVNGCQKSEHVVQPYADNSGAEDIVLESSEESYEYKVKVPKRKKSKKCEQVSEESSEEVILTAKSSEERKKDCGCSGSSEEAIISSEESYECPKSKKKFRKVKPDSTEDYGYSSEEILISKSSKSAESPEYSEESCGCSKRRRYEEDSEYESEESEEYRKPRRKYSSEEYTSPEEDSYEEPEAVYVKSRKSRYQPECESYEYRPLKRSKREYISDDSQNLQNFRLYTPPKTVDEKFSILNLFRQLENNRTLLHNIKKQYRKRNGRKRKPKIEIEEDDLKNETKINEIEQISTTENAKNLTQAPNSQETDPNITTVYFQKASPNSEHTHLNRAPYYNSKSTQNARQPNLELDQTSNLNVDEIPQSDYIQSRDKRAPRSHICPCLKKLLKDPKYSENKLLCSECSQYLPELMTNKKHRRKHSRCHSKNHKKVRTNNISRNYDFLNKDYSRNFDAITFLPDGSNPDQVSDFYRVFLSRPKRQSPNSKNKRYKVKKPKVSHHPHFRNDYLNFYNYYLNLGYEITPSCQSKETIEFDDEQGDKQSNNTGKIVYDYLGHKYIERNGYKKLIKPDFSKFDDSEFEKRIFGCTTDVIDVKLEDLAGNLNNPDLEIDADLNNFRSGCSETILNLGGTKTSLEKDVIFQQTIENTTTISDTTVEKIEANTEKSILNDSVDNTGNSESVISNSDIIIDTTVKTDLKLDQSSVKSALNSKNTDSQLNNNTNLENADFHKNIVLNSSNKIDSNSQNLVTDNSKNAQNLNQNIDKTTPTNYLKNNLKLLNVFRNFLASDTHESSKNISDVTKNHFTTFLLTQKNSTDYQNISPEIETYLKKMFKTAHVEDNLGKLCNFKDKINDILATDDENSDVTPEVLEESFKYFLLFVNEFKILRFELRLARPRCGRQ